MGCISSDTASPAVITASTITTIPDFTVVAQQVKQTWPDIQRINKLGAKTFAHLIYKYPEFRSYYHIPEAYKTESELLNADEIQEAGEQFIVLYSDIIENSETRFDAIVQEKAAELYRQGVRVSQVKCYGESLVHVIKYELQNEFNIDEKQSWQYFTNQVSNGLASALAKFPRRSIV